MPLRMVIVALLLAGCQPSWQTLKPNQEERIAGLVEPGSGELRDDWEWHNAWVEQTRVTVTYGPLGQPPASCAEAPLCLALVHPSRAASKDTPAGEFALRVVADGGEADAGPVAQGLAARLAAQGDFWEADWAWGLVLIEGALALLLLAVLLGLAVPHSTWRNAAGWSGVVVVGFLLRYMVAPQAPIHENHHGLVNLFNVLSGNPPVHHVTSSYFALLQGALGWFGGGETALFVILSLCGALAAPVWGWLVARLTRHEAAGWIAGILWAVMPLAARLGGTETPFVFATLLLPGAALALAWGLERTDRLRGGLALLLAVILSALLGQCRVLTVAFVPAAWLLGVALRKPQTRREWGLLVAVAMGTVLLLWPHVADILAAAEGREGAERYIGLASYGESFGALRMLVFRPGYVAPTLLPLAGVGGAFLVRSNRFKGTGALLGAAWMLGTTGLVSTCTSLHLALELPLLATLNALGAVGIVALAGLFPHRIVRWGVVGLAGLATLAPFGVYRLSPPDVQEYRVLAEEVLPTLRQESGATLFVADNGQSGREPIPLAWWQDRLPEVRVRPLSGEQKPGPGDYIYSGLTDGACAGWGEGLEEVLVRPVALPDDRFLCNRLSHCPAGSSSLSLLRVPSQ